MPTATCHTTSWTSVVNTIKWCDICRYKQTIFKCYSCGMLCEDCYTSISRDKALRRDGLSLEEPVNDRGVPEDDGR